MHSIAPLQQASRQAVEDRAKAAADSHTPLVTANVFLPGSLRYDWFALAFHERQRELETAAPT